MNRTSTRHQATPPTPPLESGGQRRTPADPDGPHPHGGPTRQEVAAADAGPTTMVAPGPPAGGGPAAVDRADMDRAGAGTTWGHLAGLGLVLGVLTAWEVTVRIAQTPPWILPTPSAIATALVADASWLARSGLVTLGEAAGGLVLGSAIGLGAAVAITFVPRLERAVLSLALLAKSTPVIAVAPILTIWLGFGHAPKVLVTALLTFFPMLINALEGFRSVDPAIVDWMRSVNASQSRVFRHARWPSAWPHLFTALKVSAPLAMIGAVVAEWMGASDGLGRAMWLAYTNLRMPELFAAVVVLTVLSAFVYQLVVTWERRVMQWRTPTPTGM